MTYILGARCVDGVVLVSDQKRLRGNIPSYKEKLMQVLPSVVMGGAGTSGLIERFSDEIKEQVQNQQITQYIQLLQFVENRSIELSQTYAPRVGHFEILIGVRVVDTARLYNIVTQQGFAEPVKEHVAIGSGVPYGSLLLEKFWDKNMTMNDFAKLGYLLIKFVIEMKLDDNVGGEPIVWFIPDVLQPVKSQQELDSKYPVKVANQDEIEKMEKYSKEKLSKINQFLCELVQKIPITSSSIL